MRNFLSVLKGKITDAYGKQVMLRGINFGCWLNMEGYILGGRNISESSFKRAFAAKNGRQAVEDFSRSFRRNFIREEDFKNVKASGFNCLRIPFTHRLLERPSGIAYLKEAVKLCKKYRIYCILDLHAAPGSQNPDWHADSDGCVRLWKERSQQKKFLACWELLAEIFKDEEAVAGYDILNEPVCADARRVLRLYQSAVKAIRAIDQRHIIFLEGNPWGQNLDFIGRPWDDNLVYSPHFYSPVEFTFNWVRNAKYPGWVAGKYWSRDALRLALSPYLRIQRKYRVPIYIGEFGQNNRCPHCAKELQWLKDTLALFDEFAFHWTYWTYKAVAGPYYPDGLYQYNANPVWLTRERKSFGWENWPALWKAHKYEISESFNTRHFTLNRSVYTLLNKAAGR